MQNPKTRNSDEKILIRSAYSQKPRVQISFTGQGRTKQNHKAECDINQIMERFLRTGIIDFTQKNEPRYGDVTALDYQTAMLHIAKAKSMFEELPAQVRAFFRNEPRDFLEFVQDPANRKECAEMGLLTPEAAAKARGNPHPHGSDDTSPHEPLRAPDGTYREHTRAEKRAEAKADREAKADKTNSST